MSRFRPIMKEGRMVKLEMTAGAVRNNFREEYELWCVMLWATWRYLCRITREEDRLPRPSEGECSAIFGAYRAARASCKDQQKLSAICGERRWKIPPEGVFRVDVDVLLKPDENLFGVRLIIRDWKGDIKAAEARRTIPKRTVMVAEIMSVVEGIIVSQKVQLMPIVIYTNSLLAARVLSNEEEGNEMLPEDIEEIMRIAKENMLCGVYHMYREANKAPHALAQDVRKDVVEVCWVENYPRRLTQIVKDDG